MLNERGAGSRILWMLISPISSAAFMVRQQIVKS